MPGTDPKRVGVFVIRNECASMKGRVFHCWDKKLQTEELKKLAGFVRIRERATGGNDGEK